MLRDCRNAANARFFQGCRQSTGLVTFLVSVVDAVEAVRRAAFCGGDLRPVLGVRGTAALRASTRDQQAVSLAYRVSDWGHQRGTAGAWMVVARRTRYLPVVTTSYSRSAFLVAFDTATALGEAAVLFYLSGLGLAGSHIASR